MNISDRPAKDVLEIIKKKPIAVMGVGNIEYHGAHAPLGTDYLVPNYIGKQLLIRDDILVLPSLPYGSCQSIMSFPGTINIGTINLTNILNSIVDSLIKMDIKKIIFINGHGGNIAALDQVGLDTYEKGGIATTINWWNLAKEINKEYDGGHGDIQETSVAMSIDINSVNLEFCESLKINNLSEKITSEYITLNTFQKGNIKIIRNFKDIVPNGWVGSHDPKNATKELGDRILKDVIAYIDDFITEFSKI